MALNLQGKKAIVAEVNEAANGALSAVVADSRGVTVGAITALRKEAREAGVWMKVVRNTLAKRAVEGTEFDENIGEVIKDARERAIEASRRARAAGSSFGVRSNRVEW